MKFGLIFFIVFTSFNIHSKCDYTIEEEICSYSQEAQFAGLVELKQDGSLNIWEVTRAMEQDNLFRNLRDLVFSKSDARIALVFLYEREVTSEFSEDVSTKFTDILVFFELSDYDRKYFVLRDDIRSEALKRTILRMHRDSYSLTKRTSGTIVKNELSEPILSK